MNVFVQRPYEDELFYSQCVRYLSQFPMVGQKRLLVEMFGTSLRLSPHLARDLHSFSERAGLATSVTKEELFWEHSMYPFLCSYLPDEKKAAAMEYAYYGNGLRIVPNVVSAVVPPEFLQWCPDCVAEDRARRECREAYWRRAHQIPGIWQCEKHGCELINSTISRSASQALHVPAEIAIPQDVQKFRQSRSCSSMEGALRIRLLALLNAKEFVRHPEQPNFKGAAVRAGFGPSHAIDYSKLYEDFSHYWGDLLARVDAQHRMRVMGEGWMRDIFNAKESIYQPVFREMIGIYFHDRFGFAVNDVPTDEPLVRRSSSTFYCPNPYAEHGPGTAVKRPRKFSAKIGMVRLSCECGFTAWVPETAEGKAITLADVTQVTKYGPSWAKRCAKLRAEGMSLSEIALALGLRYHFVSELCRAAKTSRKSISTEQRAENRAKWLAILGEIAPGPPALARQRHRNLYNLLLREDREWFKESIKTYRREHNHSLTTVDWQARDEEYTEAVIAAAARLQMMRGTGCLTVNAVVEEAGIVARFLTKSAQHFPRTIATLTRIAEKPWAAFLPYLESGKGDGGEVHQSVLA